MMLSSPHHPQHTSHRSCFQTYGPLSSCPHPYIQVTLSESGSNSHSQNELQPASEVSSEVCMKQISQISEVDHLTGNHDDGIGHQQHEPSSCSAL
jgi:hypothetical protein